jgi:NAD(P)-dependent dehydrogenase (short-subunit alcohol dehydrogenase family)
LHPSERFMTFANRVVFITGAGSGIGAALARECARQGATVILFDRRERAIVRAAAALRALGYCALARHGDVTSALDLRRAVAAARRRYGRIDVVVANAGYEVTGRLEELTIADFRRQFETNVFGVLRTIYATLGDLKRSRGSLVLVGSLLGHIALPGTAAYAMSKFAVTALAQSLRFELARAGVCVTLVSPGNVATNIRRVDNRNRLHARARDPIPPWLRITPETAARAIAAAVRHRRPEVVLTRLAKLAVVGERLAPSLVAAAIKAGGIRGRREPG